MSDMEILIAARDAFNARHHPGDEVRVFQTFNHTGAARSGKSVLRTVGDGAFVHESGKVFVKLAPKRGLETAVPIRLVEWRQ